MLDQLTMLSQYDTDKARLVELFSSFTGISKSKVSLYLTQYPTSTLFEHPTALEPSNAQLKKINQLRELQSVYKNLSSNENTYTLNSSSKAGDYFVNYFTGIKDKEYFSVAFLNSQNSVIATKNVSQGTVNETYLHPREIVKYALYFDASSVILAHNHPGGSTRPSSADLHSTKNICKALEAVSIPVTDHIIVGYPSYMSFAEQGMPLSYKDIASEVKNTYNAVVREYSKEFPAIKHVSEKTANYIHNLNKLNGMHVSISEIKRLYKQAGKNFEASGSIEDKKDFENVQSVVDDLKQAQLKEKNVQARAKANSLSKSTPSIEMA